MTLDIIHVIHILLFNLVVSSSSTSEVRNIDSSKSTSPLVPVVVSSVCGIILALDLLIVLVYVALFIVYKRQPEVSKN